MSKVILEIDDDEEIQCFIHFMAITPQLVSMLETLLVEIKSLKEHYNEHGIRNESKAH